jgi:predicted RNase H-like nuclease (RuvC/YqgF family)
MLQNKISRIFVVCLAALMGCFSANSFAASKLDQSVQVEVRIDKNAAEAQKQIDRLAEQTLDLNAEYKSTLTRIEQFKAYNRRLELSIQEQEKEMASLQQQMNTIDDTERGLMPLMDEMIDVLAKFVELDVPFKKEERLARIEGLRTTMLRADVSTSEKYRRVLSAYTTEIAYGNSVEVYEGKMDIDGVERQVDFLMFGRTALVFATRGANKQAAIYLKSKGAFEWLNGDEVDAVVKAIKDIRLKSKKLIVLPVATPENA